MSAYWRDDEDQREHSVYRLYNDSGDLLYIGCARDVEQRLMLHHVFGYTLCAIEEYPNKASARAAERAAIKAEAPLLNKQHNPQRFKGRKGGGFDAVEPIHPITARMLWNERPMSHEEIQEQMRAGLERVAERLGIGAA